MPNGPQFRAEHIGSLLRPPELLAQRKAFTDGLISAEALRRATDDAVRAAIDLQRDVGLKVVTDGEYRRHAYNDYFFEHLGDVTIAFEPVNNEAAVDGAKRAPQPKAVIKSRIKWTSPIHAQEVTFLHQHSPATPKITLPGPCALHFRGGDAAVLQYGAYANVDDFWADIVDAYVSELRALAEAGCTYVQLDETAFAKFADPDVQQSFAARGEDWQQIVKFYIDITNRILAACPASIRVVMHLCRGNRAGHFHAEGSYELIADKLFNELNIPCYFLEYDSPRAGDFSPLRHLPSSKSVVLGLISTKSSEMETKDDVKRRIEAATQFVDIDRMGISPQCGFASVDKGNPITPAAQEQKLRLVVEVAQEIWPDA